uniref:uncharacterized protein LOC120343524 n=1 Tax=Styela clava TaxID=7725 RepID=UPI001939FE8A|nr:uncharacterized protein LOC120343524 [Styela clava]
MKKMKVYGVIIFSICVTFAAKGDKCFSPAICLKNEQVTPSWIQVRPIEQCHWSVSKGNIPLQNENSRMNKTIEELQLTIQLHETKMEKMKVEFEEILEKFNASMLLLQKYHSDCDVYYSGMCFKIPLNKLPTKKNFNLTHAVEFCKKIGWKLASVYSVDHYNLIASYVRTKISSSMSWTMIWLGMTWDSNAETMHLSNGELAPELPWRETNPSKNMGWDKIGMLVKLDENAIQGIVTVQSDNMRHGALCEK